MDSKAQHPRSRVGGSTTRACRQTGPIYKRLPYGPHSLDARAVHLHQRARIHGAMVVAVSRKGYESVSVKDVIVLAAVSRRSFYEHFTNREDCFLATIDLTASRILERARRAHESTEGAPLERLAVALSQLADSATAERQGVLLVLEHWKGAGAAGEQHLLGGIATGERMLATALADYELPTPVIRGIAGGICGILCNRLREGSSASALATALTAWTLAQLPASGTDLPARLGELLRAQARRGEPVGTEDPTGTTTCERERLLDGALRAGGECQGSKPSAVEIADAADLPIETFFEQFDDGPQCLRIALVEAGRELLELTVSAGEACEAGPESIRRTLADLLGHMAARPLQAQALTGAVSGGEQDGRDQNQELREAIGAALRFGAPAPGFLPEATVGALIHTIRSHLAQGQVNLLPAVSDQLGYVALAPLLGATGAVEALEASGGDRP